VHDGSSEWVTTYKSPCGSRLRRVNNTSELSSLVRCQRQHLIRSCGSAGWIIQECGLDGDLDFSIGAITHDVRRLSRRLTLCFSFVADVCTVGRLSECRATTGCQDAQCTNSGESWFHVGVIANMNGGIKLQRGET
jgi:hypothetical protein